MTRPYRRSLAVLFAVNVLNFYDRNAPGALMEPIRREFNLNDTQLGALVTFFILLYAIVGVPLGRLSDSVSRKYLLAGGVTVWALMTASAGLATSYMMLLVSRLGVGVGESVCAPSATSWIGDLVPANRRSRALAFFMMAVPLGTMLSFSVSGPAAQAWGWRVALVLAALPAVVLVPLLLTLPEPRRGAAEGTGATGRPIAPLALLRIPTFRWIIASGVFLNFNLYVFASFLPSFLTRFHGLAVGRSGLLTGLGLGGAGAVCGLIVAAFGDRLIGWRLNGRMVAAAIAMLAAAPVAYAGISLPAGDMAAIPLVLIASGILNAYYGLVYSSIQDIVEPRSRGTAMSVYFLAMYLCGASFGPMLTGRLSDLFAQRALASGMVSAEAARAIGLRDAMYIIPVLSIALAFVLWMGSRTIERDRYSTAR